MRLKIKTSIGRLFFLSMAVISFISIVSIGSLLLVRDFRQMKSETQQIRDSYIEKQKQQIKNEVEKAIDLIAYQHSLSEKRLKAFIKSRTYEAVSIAQHLYDRHHFHVRPEKMQQLIFDALRGIRFNQGRGYYFATRLDGLELLFADRPEMEGKNILSMRDPSGRYVIKDMIEIAKTNEEGFYQYKWTKPNETGKNFPKTAFIKYFEPIDGFIGTGDYQDNMEHDIQQEVLNQIGKIRYGNDGYIFVVSYQGVTLMNGVQPELIGKDMWDTTDPYGVKVIQEERRAVDKPDGDFINYHWEKPSTGGISPKISFVKGYSDWQWIVGAGVYTDEVEKQIAAMEAKSRNSALKKMAMMGLILMVILFGILLISVFLSHGLSHEFGLLIAFFRRMESEGKPIDTDDLSLNELKKLGISANTMLAKRQKAEDDLRSSEEHISSIFRSAPVGIGSVVDRVLKKVNSRMCQMTGYDEAELIGQSARMLYPDDEEFALVGRNKYAQIAQNGTGTVETRWQRKNGSVIEVLLSSTPVDLHDQSKGVTFTALDITERKKLEERIIASQKMESIGTLAGGIAHDFNNILFPIVGMAEMLLEDLPEDSLERENAQEILKAGKRGSALVKQILTFSRQSEHKKIMVRPQQVVKEVIKLMRSTLPTNIKISSDLDPECGSVMADPTQLHQIAMNLLTNAYHAVEQNNGAIAVGLEETQLGSDQSSESPLPPGRYAMLTVSDTGTGIDDGTIEKIFDPYFTTKEQGKGTGLGLAVVYGIVKEHGGDIKVFSQIGKGTTFKVYLPVIARRNEPYHAHPNEDLPTGTESILLVDDEPAIVQLEKQMLERLGYRVTAHQNSLQTLKAFKTDKSAYDLVITDMTMPDMTGDTLARNLIALRPDIRIIMCTGFSEKIDPKRAAAIGIKGFLMKPVVRSELAKMVRKVLDQTENREH